MPILEFEILRCVGKELPGMFAGPDVLTRYLCNGDPMPTMPTVSLLLLSRLLIITPTIVAAATMMTTYGVKLLLWCKLRRSTAKFIVWRWEIRCCLLCRVDQVWTDVSCIQVNTKFFPLWRFMLLCLRSTLLPAGTALLKWNDWTMELWRKQWNGKWVWWRRDWEIQTDGKREIHSERDSL